MKFERVLSEAVGGRVSDTKSGQEGMAVGANRMNAADIAVADFDVEITQEKSGEFRVGGRVRRTSDNALKNVVIPRTSTQEFVKSLSKTVQSKGYKIDVMSFKSFFKTLVDKSKTGKARNKAFVKSGDSPTKENPKPAWDAYFRLERKGGTNNTLSFSDLDPNLSGVQSMKWNKSGEVEKTAKVGMLDRIAKGFN